MSRTKQDEDDEAAAAKAAEANDASTTTTMSSRLRRCLERPLWRRTPDCTVLQVRQKLASYVSQDQRKGRGAAVPPLTVNATLALLESAGYRCMYCQREMPRVWSQPRDPLQWTLDRIDNDRPHQIDNVVPSCMECNLRRRTRGHARFHHGAQIVLACGDGNDGEDRVDAKEEEEEEVEMADVTMTVYEQRRLGRRKRLVTKEEWVVVKKG